MPKSYSQLRLMQLVIGLGPGGTERLVIDMTREINEHAFVMVCCLDEMGDWAEQVTEVGVEMVCVDRQAGFDWRLGLKIAKICRKQDINVIHCHHYSPYVYGALAGLRQLGVKVVYTEHGRLSDGKPSLKRKIANQIFGHLPGSFFAVSHELREHMLMEGFPKRRLSVVHNGIAAGEQRDAMSTVKAREVMGLNKDEFVIGTVARLDPVKDLGNLIDAFALFRKKHDAGKLVVVGDGEEMGMLKNKVKEHEIGDAVIFMGKRDDVRMLLHGFDVYVNCSVTEGISVTILEAMATDVCVVATDVGGTGEIITDGKDGVLIEARDNEKLFEGLSGLYTDREKLNRIRLAGRKRIEQSFSMSRMVNSYLKSYGVEGV